MNGSILLATFGTLGDVHPFVALAKALRARGHPPVIATSAMHQAIVESEGLDFVAMRPDEPDIAQALGLDIAAVFKRMLRDPHFILDEIYLRFLAQTYDDVLRASAGARMVVAHSLLIGAHLAAEKRGLPAIRAALSPIHLQSAVAPSLTPPLPYVLQPCVGAARGYNRGLREILRRRLMLKLRPVQAFRREVGLPSTRDEIYIACGRRNSADAIAGFYSAHFAPLQPDHPDNASLVGFPLQRSQGHLDHDLAAFLSAGEPPLVFTLGSFAVEASGAFYEHSIEAARRLGRPAILLTGTRDLARVAALAGPGERVRAYVPHGLLFPHAAGIVHHGGMGTTAEALRSGRPQLVVPFFGDQPDNAARLARLGVARILAPSAYRPKRVATLLDGLMHDDTRATAEDLAARLAEEDGAESLVNLIEAILARRERSAA